MADRVDSLVEMVAVWEDVRVEPHRFGGKEFLWQRVEIGHVHRSGLVDVPFTRRIREQLVTENLARPHHIQPESGWISYVMRSDADLEHARWLLRLSYLQKRLRRDSAARDRLEIELAQLTSDPALRDFSA